MRRKGQSILEYAIVLAAVIAVIVIVARNILGTSLNTALTNASNRIATEADGLSR